MNITNSVHSTSENDPTSIQIDVFKKLVKEVNSINGMKPIVLNASSDKQRDALAFIVDSVYLQYQDNDWNLILNDLPDRVRKWNTPPDGSEASKKILEFIDHLLEFRIKKIISNPSLSEDKKAQATAYKNLFSSIINGVLKEAKEKPVSLSGISKSFLPEWYQKKLYLSP